MNSNLASSKWDKAVCVEEKFAKEVTSPGLDNQSLKKKGK